MSRTLAVMVDLDPHEVLHDTEPSDLIHDPWLTCAGESLRGIAAEVFEKCEKLHKAHSNRKPRRDALERRRLLTDNLIANLAGLVLRPSPMKGIAISTRRQARTRYDRPEFPPHLVSDALTNLDRLGLIRRHTGVRNRSRTSFEASPKLQSRILAEVGRHEVGRSAGGETIILHASPHIRGRPKPLVDYQDTAETHQFRSEMATINEHLTRANITVDGVSASPIHLTRRFQIRSIEAPSTFDQHGRLYGGFWINMHRAERHRIRIDGQELADLDFTGMLTQLAYVHADLPPPLGDPYGGIEGMVGPETSAELHARQRDAVKRGLNAFFFRTGRMRRLPPVVKQLLGPDWNATRFAAALRKRHGPIKHLFGTGLGLRLMFAESQIMVRCLLNLRAADVVALPIHDGLMVKTSCVELALAAMREASINVTGWELPVKVKLVVA